MQLLKMKNDEFKGKIVLITGASSGIGAATAIKFAKLGAKVVINYKSSTIKANTIVKQIHSSGGTAISIKCDISNESQVKKMAKKINLSFGKVDILVNNAGFAKQNSFLSLNKADFQKTLDVNLIGPFLCCKHMVDGMIKKQYGKIINISSIRGLNSCARKDIIDYSAAKAGLINLTCSLAKELTPHGINVNAIAPAITRTELIKKLSNAAKQKALEGSLIKRMIEPDEIAHSILFLSSKHSDYITGEVITIDGGYRLTSL